MFETQKIKSDSPSLVVAAAVNDDKVLSTNLAASPWLRDEKIPLIIKRGYQSASAAYNSALERTNADVVVFAHQDVYLPRGWGQKLLSAIETLECEEKNWAVLGIIGVDGYSNAVGKAWSTGLGHEVGAEFLNLTPVRSVDELLIVLRTATKLHFDNNLPGFHLYGTDIVQTATKRGFEAYVFDGPVIHNSLPIIQLDRSYIRAYRYMQHKWQPDLPLYTTVLPITRFGWPLLRKLLSQKKKYIFRHIPTRQQSTRLDTPSQIAQILGYEK